MLDAELHFFIINVCQQLPDDRDTPHFTIHFMNGGYGVINIGYLGPSYFIVVASRNLMLCFRSVGFRFSASGLLRTPLHCSSSLSDLQVTGMRGCLAPMASRFSRNGVSCWNFT